MLISLHNGFSGAPPRIAIARRITDSEDPISYYSFDHSKYMAPCPEEIVTEICTTLILTVTETTYQTTTMRGPNDPNWGVPPGWAVAGPAPTDDSDVTTSADDSDNNAATVDIALSDVESTATSLIATTETIGLASTSSTAPASNNSAHDSTSPSHDASSSSSNPATIAGPIIGGVAGVGLIALLLLLLCRKKPGSGPRFKLKIKRKSAEDKENIRRLHEAEEIAADRERALRNLEQRRKERFTHAPSFVGGGHGAGCFNFGSLGVDSGRANGIEATPGGRQAASPRSPRWI